MKRLRAVAAWLGLTGADGMLSFSKMVTLTVLALSYVTGTFGLGIAVAAIASSHGTKAFLAFLTRHTSQASATMHTDTAELAKVIRARRDEDAGAEPT